MKMRQAAWAYAGEWAQRCEANDEMKPPELLELERDLEASACVPKEPTVYMLTAGASAFNDAGGGLYAENKIPQMWRAMISAAEKG